MIGRPTIEVNCDECFYDDTYTLIALDSPGWDSIAFMRQILKDGWKVEGDLIFCKDCAGKGPP